MISEKWALLHARITRRKKSKFIFEVQLQDWQYFHFIFQGTINRLVTDYFFALRYPRFEFEEAYFPNKIAKENKRRLLYFVAIV